MIELLLNTIFTSFIIITVLILLLKNYKKLKVEMMEQPLTFIVDSFILIGIIVFFIGITILDKVLLIDLGFALIFIGSLINSLFRWNSSKDLPSFKRVGLMLLFLLFYIFYLRELYV